VREARRGSKKYFQLVSTGAANSGIFQMLAGKAIEGDFSGMKFGLANALKDVRYYNQMAMEFGVVGSMAAATLQTLTQAVNLGFGGPEHLSLRWFRQSPSSTTRRFHQTPDEPQRHREERLTRISSHPLRPLEGEGWGEVGVPCLCGEPLMGQQRHGLIRSSFISTSLRPTGTWRRRGFHALR